MATRIPSVLLLALAALAPAAPAAEGQDKAQPVAPPRDTVIVERFENLDQWRPLYFPKIKEHSTYAAMKDEGGTFLRAESHASASGIVCRKTFDVRQYPRMRWRWKVDGIYEKGNATTKAGDDFPIRVLILFKYDPDRAGLLQRMQYGTVRLLYGEYPPDSSLGYVWGNRENETGIIINPYTDRERSVILERGRAKVGGWVEEEVDILGDYRRAFGKDPPPEAGLAVMNDSDNTGEASVSYVADMEVYRSDAAPRP